MDMNETNDQFGQNDSILSKAVDQKVDYLNQLNESINNGDDLKIYELIDKNRYLTEFMKQEESMEPDYFNLVSDLHDELSHHLSNRLIDYLGKTYPFFYYHEYQLGQFKIYFGNWWDHRMLGELDSINVKFMFDEDEFNRLADSFKLELDNRRVNDATMKSLADENENLTQLLEQQDQRDAQKDELRQKLQENEEKSPMPWEAAKIKEEKERLNSQLLELTNLDEKAAGGRQQIKENENKILALSKEETILTLEKQNIRSTFGSFEAFNDNNAHLYEKYLEYLQNESQVSDHE
ncbi:hypothetical protein [Lentilactobacillus sp. Marseille-Q4993]|uniref:hypothetical protein n=1 Tax=Lentilactobacillus sp. Marseille-Q4993 TaxID=3039492 RepID=UPI0024BC33C8|nr:hypothetical protein [Lentilactobacillus sp. Marseille-Q4993]